MKVHRPNPWMVGRDLGLIAVSIIVAGLLVKTGLIRDFINLGGDGWLTALLGGAFFTSAFTVAPAIAALTESARSGLHPLMVAAVGALGSVFGDFIIFHLVRDRFSESFGWLTKFPRSLRLRVMFRPPLARWSLFLIGALIIASPFPDELGLTLMGLSKVKNRYFLVVSYVCNFVGIWALASVVRAL